MQFPSLDQLPGPFFGFYLQNQYDRRLFLIFKIHINNLKLHVFRISLVINKLKKPAGASNPSIDAELVTGDRRRYNALKLK